MSLTPSGRFTGAGARVPSDGPRWLYAAPGRLRAPWRLMVFGLVLLVTQPIADAVITPIVGAVGRAVEWRLEAYPWVTAVAVWAALAVALRSVDLAPWAAVGLDRSAWRPGRLVAGGLVGLGALGVTMGVLWMTGSVSLRSVGGDAGMTADLWSTESWGRVAVRVGLFLAPAALWEEWIFRGYLWTVAEAAGGIQVARWSTAVVFGLVHLLNPGVTVISTLAVVVAGLALGALREGTGSLAVAWLAHWGWNWGMAALWHVPVSGIPFATPSYRTVVQGPVWWTGGAWGPEGGAAALVVLGTAVVGGTWWRTRTSQTRTGKVAS